MLPVYYSITNIGGINMDNSIELSSGVINITNIIADDAKKLNGYEPDYYLDYNNLKNKPSLPNNGELLSLEKKISDIQINTGDYKSVSRSKNVIHVNSKTGTKSLILNLVAGDINDFLEGQGIFIKGGGANGTNLISRITAVFADRLEIADNIGRDITGALCEHDDSSALQALIQQYNNIVVADGDYLIHNEIKLENLSDKKVVLNGNAVLYNYSNSNQSIIRISACKNIVISGGNFDGGSNSNLSFYKGLIYIGNSSDIVIYGIKSKNNPRSGLVGASGVNNCTFSNCSIEYSNNGIWLNGCSKIKITDNVIERSGQVINILTQTDIQCRGIRCNSCSYVSIVNNVIKDFDIGIEIFEKCTKVSVSNNIVESPWCISFDRCDDFICDGNKVYSSTRGNFFNIGIELAQGCFGSVTNNVIKVDTSSVTQSNIFGIAILQSGTWGINSSNDMVYANNVIGCKRAVYMSGANDIQMRDNVLEGRKNDSGIMFGGKADSINVINNTISQFKDGITFNGNLNVTNVLIEGNRIHDNSGAGIICNNAVTADRSALNPNTNIGIHSNIIYNNGARAISMRIPNSTILNNIITKNAMCGIYMMGCNNSGSLIVIEGNKNVGNAISGETEVYINDIPLNCTVIYQNNIAYQNAIDGGIYGQGGVRDGIMLNSNNVQCNGTTMRNSSIVYSPSAPTWGKYRKRDIALNIYATENGTPGSKYINLGWFCTASGEPGTWKEIRVLTGN